MPNFVPEEKLATANSLSLVASYGTFPLGGIIFAALAVVATGSVGSRRCRRSR